ncbi:MAG TPA: antibiotic biosynthesis monooxygenase [Blastocatellia bacterium]|nr:antibiotic biosynthesis monooxygenase [Blastocatellia bacterium]
MPTYPENYKVRYENDRVRVIDFTLKKGARENFHSHPAHVLYVLAPLKIRFTFPDGRTALREAKPGDVLFSEPVTHASENIGDNDAHGLLVELKRQNSGMSGEEALGVGDLVTAVTFIHGIEGKEDELKQHLLSLTAPTRAEAGNLAYDLYQSANKKNEFLRFEVWRHAAALEAHKTTPPLKASFELRQREGWTTEITLWNRIVK